MLKIDCGAKTTVLVTLNIFYDKATIFLNGEICFIRFSRKNAKFVLRINGKF